jgi:hypothetical protein
MDRTGLEDRLPPWLSASQGGRRAGRKGLGRNAGAPPGGSKATDRASDEGRNVVQDEADPLAANGAGNAVTGTARRSVAVRRADAVP